MFVLVVNKEVKILIYYLPNAGFKLIIKQQRVLILKRSSINNIFLFKSSIPNSKNMYLKHYLVLIGL